MFLIQREMLFSVIISSVSLIIFLYFLYKCVLLQSLKLFFGLSSIFVVRYFDKVEMRERGGGWRQTKIGERKRAEGAMK